MKVFFNNIPLILCDVEEAQQYENSKTLLKGRFLNIKMLHSYIDMLEKPHQFEQVVIFSENIKQLKKDFKGLFKIMKAAGGVVKNENGEILFIYRRGSWDLPKGKIDPGETKKDAAIREVQEETGIQNIILGKKIKNTYHTYNHRNQRVLKKTYWYNMTTNELDLTPQAEEDIEQAIWQSKEDFLAENKNIYKGLLAVLDKV